MMAEMPVVTLEAQVQTEILSASAEATEYTMKDIAVTVEMLEGALSAQMETLSTSAAVVEPEKSLVATMTEEVSLEKINA